MTPRQKQFGAAGEEVQVQCIATPVQRSTELDQHSAVLSLHCRWRSAVQRQLSRLSQRSAAYV